MRRDFQIALVLAVASLPAGLMMSEAMEAFPFLKQHPDSGFWLSLGTTIVLLVIAVAMAIHGEREAEFYEGNKRMLAFGGMVFFGGGFIVCLAWYLLGKTTTLTANGTINFVISTSPIGAPSYDRISGLKYIVFDGNKNENRELDIPMFVISDVYIMNTSKDTTINLNINLIAVSEDGFRLELDSKGETSFGERMGVDDMATKIFSRRTTNKVLNFVLSPLAIEPQKTVHGSIPFLLDPFVFEKYLDDIAMRAFGLPIVDRPDIKKFSYILKFLDPVSGKYQLLNLPGKL